jgi:hypothetical protein
MMKRLLITIKLYGMVEVATGVIKIMFLAIVIIVMIVVNVGGEHQNVRAPGFIPSLIEWVCRRRNL